MHRRHTLAYVLIALGVLALLAQTTGTADWILLGVLAVASLVAYTNTRGYAFLVLGAVFAGSALGVLLTGLFRFDGVFLVSLGAALVAVDRIEPRGGRWAAYLGTVLVAIGLIAALADSGVLGSAWLPIALIAIGLALLWRNGRETRTFPPPVREPAPASDAPPGAHHGAQQTPVEPGSPQASSPPAAPAASTPPPTPPANGAPPAASPPPAAPETDVPSALPEADTARNEPVENEGDEPPPRREG